MARDLTPPQRALLRSDRLRVNLLSTWYMDEGTFRYSDSVDDLTWTDEGESVIWIGANALASSTEIKSGSAGFSSESITLTIDGTRMSQAGFPDPAAFFQVILALPLANRRVDLQMAFSSMESENVQFVQPLYAGKINNVKLIDSRFDFESMGSGDIEQPKTRLEVELDSLAARYQWVSGRVRSHQDQLELDPSDMFFSYVQENIRGERSLYWGKAGPGGNGLVTQNGNKSTGGGGVVGKFDILRNAD